MDRGVIVGGGLIAASFLVATLLNRWAHEEAHPVEAPAALPAVACEERAPSPPGATPAAQRDAGKCQEPPAEPELK